MKKNREAKIKIINDPEGKIYISSYDRRLWDFTYQVLFKFKCPIQFKVIGPDVTRHMDEYIKFFVPKGRQDIADYIIQEWEHEVKTEDNKDKKVMEEIGWRYSTYISIYYYKGIDIYIEEANNRIIAEAGILWLMEKLRDKDSKIELEDCISKTDKLH